MARPKRTASSNTVISQFAQFGNRSIVAEWCPFDETRYTRFLREEKKSSRTPCQSQHLRLQGEDNIQRRCSIEIFHSLDSPVTANALRDPLPWWAFCLWLSRWNAFVWRRASFSALCISSSFKHLLARLTYRSGVSVSREHTRSLLL